MATIDGRLLGAQTQKPVANLRVQAWTTAPEKVRLLSEGVSDGNGAFSIDVPAVKSDVVFHVLLGDQLLLDTTGTVAWNPHMNGKPVVIAVPEKVPDPEPEPDPTEAFTVAGVVTDEVGVATSDLRVEAWDINLAGGVLLGVATTDASGGYSIAYDPAALAGKPRADLQIHVLDPRAEQPDLARSEVVYRAEPTAIRDVMVRAAGVQRTPEFDRLRATLEPMLGGRTLDVVDPDGVTYLAERSGMDARIVAMLAQAAKLAKADGIPAEHYYALMRSGAPGDPEQLLRLSDEQVEQALKTAMQQRLIPTDGSIDVTLRNHRDAALKGLRAVRSPGAVSTLGQMLSLELDDAAQTTFLDAYRAAGDDHTALWPKLAQAGFDDPTIGKLRTGAALGRLTLQNAPLVARLVSEHGAQSLDDLATAGFHDPERWNDVIGDAVPDGLTRETYARLMAAHVNLSAPTLVAADLVRSDAVKVGAPGDVADFLAAANGHHTIGVEPVRTWDGFAELSETAREAALTVERLYQLSPSNQAMAALSQLGLHSGMRIASFPRSAFVEKFGAELGGADEAARVHQKATAIHTTALNVATMYLAARANPNVYALTGTTSRTALPMTSDVVAAATLEDLFKNMDYCSCEDCSSVFSPAAYFVELLELLDVSDVPHTGANPIDVLLGRRPDLQHVLLSCENTNVALPYLDIVNEVLEHFVVNGDLTAFTGHDTSEGATTADLLADPQFVEDTAYDATKREVYPSSLPFDMPLAAMRLLAGIWGTTLTRMLEVFGDPAAARRERLGLSPDEHRILTDAGFHEPPDYFGEPAGTSIDALNTAIANGKTFCRRADITYEELAAILATRFVNPAVDLVPTLVLLRTPIARIQDWFDGSLDDGALTALFPEGLDTAAFDGDPLAWLTGNRDAIMGLITLTDVGADPVECDFAAVELRYALPKPAENRLTEIAYLRLHRFIRLWRKLGRSIELTDELITTFLPTPAGTLEPGNIDAPFATLLDRIANFELILATLDVSADAVADWLSLWNSGTDAPVARDRLAALLRIGTADLAHLVEITGIEPFADDLEEDSPSMLRFARAQRSLKTSALKVADLDYLLRHQDATGRLTPPEAQQLRDIRALRDALAAVDVDIGLAVANPDLANARAQTALVYDAEITDRFFAFVSRAWTYSTPFASDEETLPAPLAQAAPVELDPFLGQLTFTGLMSAAAHAALDAAADTLTLADVTELTTQPQLDAFVAAFKAAAAALRAEGDAELAAFVAEYPELGALVASVAVMPEPQAQATAILAAILPELRSTLTERALLTGLSAITQADGPVVEAIAAAELADLLALSDPVTMTADGAYELLLDPVTAGDAILYVAAPPGTQVTLDFDGAPAIPAATVDADGELRTTVPIALGTGTLHRLDLTLAALPADGAASLRWRTKVTAKAAVPTTRLLARAAVATARSALLRIRKGALLARKLELTAGELAHLATTDPATSGFLAFDTDGTIDADALYTQWQRVERLIWFAQLKTEHEPEPDTFLALLTDPELTTPQHALVLANVMEWDEVSLAAVLTHHGLALGDLGSLDNLRLVARTMAFVNEAQEPAADLLAWSDPAPDATLIASAKAALRARMTDAAWRDAIQPVSDALRNQRRDALVAYILFHHPPAPAITTPDRLYEHLLLDVQMDACTQTSRIRLALSTVQQFVNRCLMGLEANVSPASIRSDHWDWMQRYRVWEANRKVFVHPENWLEPELRDGKSPFFRDLESELLKSDITDDLAEEAYLSYLKKLDDVAKLEIVAAYLHQREPGNTDDDILHVFGRTNGTTREYYTRRFEYGYWTPWEKLSLNVEGDLLVPVVWKTQLFVFWVTAVTKPADGDRGETPMKIAEQQWGGNARITAELTLSWGEFYKGRWTSPKSSEMRDPLRIPDLAAFDPAALVISARTERPSPSLSERLIFSVLYLSVGFKAFKVTFTSKHSPPLIANDDPDGGLLEPLKLFNWKLFWEGQDVAQLDSNSLRLPDRSLEVAVQQPRTAKPAQEALLAKDATMLPGFRVRPLLHPVENQWEAPFFYSDEHSVFSVQGHERLWSRPWFDVFYDPGPATPIHVGDIPPLYEEPALPGKGDPVIDPWVEVVNPNFTTIVRDAKTFVFDGAEFNAQGRVITDAPAGGGS